MGRGDMSADRKELKPDWEPIYLRAGAFFLILNFPFLGLYKKVGSGVFEAGDSTLLLVAFLCLTLSLYLGYLLLRIRFGWDENGVYKQGMFKRTEIGWNEIEKIYDTGTLEGWTETDLLALKRSGKRIFIIKAGPKRIVLDHYASVAEMKKHLSQRLGLKIRDEYDFKWDFLVNG
jgi:hypothetical protein